MVETIVIPVGFFTFIVTCEKLVLETGLRYTPYVVPTRVLIIFMIYTL